MKTQLYLSKRPPSLNGLYPSNKRTGGRYKSKKYKQWIAEAMHELNTQRWRRHHGFISVGYLVERLDRDKLTAEQLAKMTDQELADRKMSDLANFEKGLSDLLVTVGVIRDDCLIAPHVLDWHADTGVHITVEDV